VKKKCDLKQLFAPIGSNYLPQVKTEQSRISSYLRSMFWNHSIAESAYWNLSIAGSALAKRSSRPALVENAIRYHPSCEVGVPWDLSTTAI
jgi:hypothetical protein